MDERILEIARKEWRRQGQIEALVFGLAHNFPITAVRDVCEDYGISFAELLEAYREETGEEFVLEESV